MYVAPQVDKTWLSTVQRRLYSRSWEIPDYVFCKLWGLITDPRNLRTAFARVAKNRGHRTAGVDRITVRMVIADGAESFIDGVRAELRSGSYQPSPVRRVLIPKAGHPGKFRPLGIPTVKDRVVQAAMKNILEPIFEADFFPSSYGFRPGRSAHAALEHLRSLLVPKKITPTETRLPYQWAIEGDIKACFDQIDHHRLMVRVRRRIGDPKANRLIRTFLKAGILAEGQLLRSEVGTPQGGILSPLLANIALGVIDERYERHVWPRSTPTKLTQVEAIQKRASNARVFDRTKKPVMFPIRYADDFIILVSAPPGPGQHERACEIAQNEKIELANFLRNELRLELSDTKTLVSPVTDRLRFLGHHVTVRRHPVRHRLVSTVVIPKDRSQRLRGLVKDLFRRSTTRSSLDERLQMLNPLLRGWSAYYRHAWGAKRVFNRNDHYVWWSILRWLRKKHPRVAWKKLQAQYGWRKPGLRTVYWRGCTTTCFRMVATRVGRFHMRDLHSPDFTTTLVESPMHSERCTSGSVRGAQKPPGESRNRR